LDDRLLSAEEVEALEAHTFARGWSYPWRHLSLRHFPFAILPPSLWHAVWHALWNAPWNALLL